ncbi:hypothetical protein KKG66_08545 [bacterium]|nr:hypothetical protein [bacterium]
MKHLIFLGLGMLVGLAMLVGCSDAPPTGAPSVSSPPAIQSLHVSPMNVIGGSTVIAVAEVTDAENVPQVFEWNVSGGQLVGSTIGPEVVWITPESGGKAFITCRVLNQFGGDEASTQVELLSPPENSTDLKVYDINTTHTPYRYEDVFPSTDGGCFVVGVMQRGIGEGWIAKLNRTGQVEWEQLLRLSVGPYNTNRSVIATPDGGCIVFGLSDHQGNNLDLSDSETDVWMDYAVKLDASGEVAWRTEFELRRFSNAEMLTDGNIALVNGGSVPEVIVLNGGGDVLWRRTIDIGYGFNDLNSKWDIRVLSDGGMLLIAKVNPPMFWPSPFAEYDTYIFKLTSQGILEWTKYYVVRSGDNKLMDLDDSHAGYMIAATSGIFELTDGTFAERLVLQGISYGGDVLWEKAYEEIATGEAVIRENDDGGFGVISTDYYSCRLSGFDQTGELVWSKASESNSSDGVAIFNVWEDDGEYRALIRYCQGPNCSLRMIASSQE